VIDESDDSVSTIPSNTKRLHKNNEHAGRGRGTGRGGNASGRGRGRGGTAASTPTTISQQAPQSTASSTSLVLIQKQSTINNTNSSTSAQTAKLRSAAVNHHESVVALPSPQHHLPNANAINQTIRNQPNQFNNNSSMITTNRSNNTATNNMPVQQNDEDIHQHHSLHSNEQTTKHLKRKFSNPVNTNTTAFQTASSMFAWND